jgi:membrane associated rhomboid family serine protease
MNEPLALCNSVVILMTCVSSFLVFRNRAAEAKYIFHPESILAGKQYYRLVTSGFLHADWPHLIWNMVSLYFFGNLVELLFGKVVFLAVYFGAIVGGNLLSLYVHRHHDYYAYGASGGVCGMIFAHILLLPGTGVFVYFIPIAVPGWLYAIIFLVGSFVAMRRARDNVGHDAHLGGAIVGLLIAAALYPSAAMDNWKIFASVLAISMALLAYLWINPLFLPLSGFRGRWLSSRSRKPDLPNHRREQLEVDAVLDKVAKGGIHSLTAKERALLDNVSGKYRRRAQSKRPDSELPI